MEAEVRTILADAVAEPAIEGERGLGSKIRARFAAIGFADDLVRAIPPRTEMGRYVDFGEE